MSSKDSRGRSSADPRKTALPGVPLRPDEEIHPEMLAQPQPQDDDIDPETLAMPQPVPQRPVVTIYVRKGSSGAERLVSINPIPAEADPIELLDAGFAIDGNSATLSVWHTQDFITWADPEEGIGSIKSADLGIFEYEPGLTDAIRAIERTIVAWLKKLGYTPKFG